MSNSDAKRDLSLDILRIIATFAVILLHVAAQKDYFETTYPTNEWIPRLFYNSFVRWCVPIFVMISGALFLNPLKNITIRRLFGKNVLRIVCAYIVWTVAYALYTILQDDKDISLLPLFSIEGYGSFHLWFLKMILGLYVAVPILRYVTKAKSIEIYFICVSLIGSFLIPFLLEVLSHYNAIISNNLKDIISTMRLDIASGYTGYFVLGHYLYSYGIKRKAYRMIVYVSGWASVLSVIIFTYCFSHHNGAVYDFLLGYLCPFTLIESIALFVKNKFWYLSRTCVYVIHTERYNRN